MICEHIPIQRFEIWQPRWHDRRVLLDARKVREHNKIIFTKAPSLGTQPYYMQGKVIRKYGKANNGTIDCFSVPLDELRPLEYAKDCEHLYK